MTHNFYTIIHLPYEGALITEHHTKAQALKTHKKNIKQVSLDKDGNLTNDSNLLGAALVHIDIIKEVGEWYEQQPQVIQHPDNSRV